jgi:hypothetical protein
MTTSRYAVLGAAAVLALLIGCGHTVPAVPTGTAPRTTPGTTVTVHADLAAGRNGAMFTEGAVPEIRLVDADGHTRSPQDDHAFVAVFRDVGPGRYRLEAVLRPCDANCDYLDGPTGRCTKDVHVSEGSTFVVSWRVGEACLVARG